MNFLRLLARGGSVPDNEHAPVDGAPLDPVRHAGSARLGARVRPGHFSLQVVVRTLLLCLLVPAVLTSRDGRGFHDVWAGTRIVRP